MYLGLTTKTDRKSPILLINSRDTIKEGASVFLCLDPSISMEEYQQILEDFVSQDPEHLNFTKMYEGEK